MPDVFIIFFLGTFGLIVGSFLNVVILRFGFSESKQARSHCMSCNAAIRAYDLIPVVSFLFLRGRCRTCGSHLSIQYPLVEIATAALFALAYVAAPPSDSLFSYFAFMSLLGFLASLIVLVVYDIRHTLVPYQFIGAIALFAAASSVFQSIHAGSALPILDSMMGGAALFACMFAIYAVTRGKGMGLGDAYIAGAIGILLGLTRGVEAIMLAFWVGTFIYVPFLLVSSLLSRMRIFPRHTRVTMKTELAFAPFLALGALLALYTNLSPLMFGAWLAQVLLRGTVFP